ncbi:TetR family transcriptional regulator [Actinospongicola halichondriae]|uniref:TetR family transcriptional regulator n=1 Tax=Actinospongicola halichondriae TaxID=3236844 RepID=UPI003D5C538B
MVVESTEGLTDTQRERRLRVIESALRLAADGGYEAVQMRDVSTAADVALGTIYRYFSSKDHLLVSAMVEWMLELETAMTRRPPRGDVTVDRVLDVLHRALRAVEREPERAAAVVKAQTSDDGAAVRASREVTEVLYRIMASAFPEGDDTERQHDIIRVLAHVWFSCLVSWTSGVGDMDWVRSEVDTAAHLLLPTP